ncbi:hypothetical protein ACFUCV_11990 [Specibacter sp. NPDC057265]|uniref:hypothetical protein n=1 Tax=Specibacter sp. NPDC057265 TaxID=3346075 RepID=UPI00363D3BFA
MPYQPIIPEGQHLGTSRKIVGAVTGHLFENGTNDLKGHAAWEWVDELVEDYSSSNEREMPRELTPWERELVDQIAAMITASTVWAVTAAAPHVKHWWKEAAVLPLKSACKRMFTPRIANKRVAAAPPTAEDPTILEAPTKTIEVAGRPSNISMTSTEWNQRFGAMLAAGDFKDEQRKILSIARIEDSDAMLDTKEPAGQLTPQQFSGYIKSMLEANPSLLDEQTSAELMRIFAGQSNLPDYSKVNKLER